MKLPHSVKKKILVRIDNFVANLDLNAMNAIPRKELISTVSVIIFFHYWKVGLLLLFLCFKRRCSLNIVCNASVLIFFRIVQCIYPI